MFRIDSVEKVIIASAGMWTVSMLILYMDQFNLDWALLVTLLVAMFGFILKLAMNDARMEQKIDDLPCQDCPNPKGRGQVRRHRSA